MAFVGGPYCSYLWVAPLPPIAAICGWHLCLLFAAAHYKMFAVTGPHSVYGVIFSEDLGISWGRGRGKKRLTPLSQSATIGDSAVEWILSKQPRTGENP